MPSSRTKTILSWALAALLAAGYAMAALGKLTGAATEMFAGWGYAPWFATLVGVLELSGAVGLLIPKLTRLAILGLGGIMIGATYTHLANGEGLQVLRPMIFAALLLTLWWSRARATTESESAA